MTHAETPWPMDRYDKPELMIARGSQRPSPAGQWLGWMPLLAPWNGFDFDGDSQFSTAVRTIANLLSDDEWHLVTDVVEVAVNVSKLRWKTVRDLVDSLRDHGDVRISRKKIRLTTRFIK